jgi:uncharacterized membrane protein
MFRLFVRSRSGNVVVAVVGAIYAIAALSILGWYIIDTWTAANTLDHILQFALLAAGACGLWLLVKALENLGVRQNAGVQRSRSNAASIQR